MSDAQPEPTNVGPIAGGNIRASDADRERVATVLSTAYAEGRLSREEHEERLNQLMAAKTLDDLIPITRDLVVRRNALNPPATPSTSFDIETGSASDQPGRLVAIFGGVERNGKWRIRKKNQVVAVFGGVDLDLRDAVFEGSTIEMSTICCFGGLDIKVPEGLEVRNEMVGIFGGTDIKDVGDPIPGAPTLVVKGLTLFGGVSIRGPKSARKRR
jgi:Domain of unknown function (DUF1707)/Cell wall-active antibiotics response 4TMS YvqF